MYNVSIVWKDGTVTHETYNDPHRTGKTYTKQQIVKLWMNNEDVEYVNVKYVGTD